MEENARAYAENGHNVAILGKKVQNLLPATTKSERMQVKMDIMQQILRKKVQNSLSATMKSERMQVKMDIMSQFLRKKSKIHCMRPRKARGCK